MIEIGFTSFFKASNILNGKRCQGKLREPGKAL
jgi:hypothetical protein